MCINTESDPVKCQNLLGFHQIEMLANDAVAYDIRISSRWSKKGSVIFTCAMSDDERPSFLYCLNISMK